MQIRLCLSALLTSLVMVACADDDSSDNMTAVDGGGHEDTTKEESSDPTPGDTEVSETEAATTAAPGEDDTATGVMTDGSETEGHDTGESPSSHDPTETEPVVVTETDEPNTDTMGDAGMDAGMQPMSLCSKYGGADVVASVVQNQVLGAIAEDCRINVFFTSLTPDGFTRVSDCLTTQVQELFSCDGVVYQGSQASNGLPCRSMAEAHLGLGISSGDFGALIEDVVSGLSAAGVESDDIAAAAPALLGMHDVIVEDDAENPTHLECMMPDAGSEEPETAEAMPVMDAGGLDAGAGQ